jgi:hypothetical protein
MSEEEMDLSEYGGSDVVDYDYVGARNHQVNKKS